MNPFPTVLCCLAFKRGSDPKLSVWARASQDAHLAEICFKPFGGGFLVEFETECLTIKRLMAQVPYLAPRASTSGA